MCCGRNVAGRECQRKPGRKERELVVVDKGKHAFLRNVELEDRATAGGDSIRLHAIDWSFSVVHTIQNGSDNVRRRDAGSDVYKIHAHKVAGVYPNCVVVEAAVEHRKGLIVLLSLGRIGPRYEALIVSCAVNGVFD